MVEVHDSVIHICACVDAPSVGQEEFETSATILAAEKLELDAQTLRDVFVPDNFSENPQIVLEFVDKWPLSNANISRCDRIKVCFWLAVSLIDILDDGLQ